MLGRLDRERLHGIVEKDEPHKFVRAGKKRVYVADMHTNHSEIYEDMKIRGKKTQPAKDAGTLFTGGSNNDIILRGSSMTLGIGGNARERKRSIKTVQRIAGKDTHVRGSR